MYSNILHLIFLYFMISFSILTIAYTFRIHLHINIVGFCCDNEKKAWTNFSNYVFLTINSRKNCIDEIWNSLSEPIILFSLKYEFSSTSSLHSLKDMIKGWDDGLSVMIACQGERTLLSELAVIILNEQAALSTGTEEISGIAAYCVSFAYSFRGNVLIGASYPFYSFEIWSTDESHLFYPSLAGSGGENQTDKCTCELRVFLESCLLLPKASPGVVNMQSMSFQGSRDSKTKKWGKFLQEPMGCQCFKKTMPLAPNNLLFVE